MKRKPSILIILFSAAITFAALFATIGKPNFIKYHSQFGHCEKTEAPAPTNK